MTDGFLSQSLAIFDRLLSPINDSYAAVGSSNDTMAWIPEESSRLALVQKSVAEAACDFI